MSKDDKLPPQMQNIIYCKIRTIALTTHTKKNLVEHEKLTADPPLAQSFLSLGFKQLVYDHHSIVC